MKKLEKLDDVKFKKLEKKEIKNLTGGDLPQQFCAACGAAVQGGACSNCGTSYWDEFVKIFEGCPSIY